jgi:hypothetical protein
MENGLKSLSRANLWGPHSGMHNVRYQDVHTLFLSPDPRNHSRISIRFPSYHGTLYRVVHRDPNGDPARMPAGGCLGSLQAY